MSSQLGPIDVYCDAPAYPVVRACRRIGILAPEDVRWCRITHFLSRSEGWKGLFHPGTWRKLLGQGPDQEKSCSCGAKLPALERVTFTFTTGREETYQLGQCIRCGTVFWEEI
jgi:hypothetical protein